MAVNLLTEHHLEFLGLKGGYTGLSESTLVKTPNCWKSHVIAHMGLVARKPVFGGLPTIKVQTSLRICAVRSAPLFFAYWKVLYLDLLQANFHFSS